MVPEVEGFSKLSKKAKIEWICKQHFNNNEDVIQVLKNYWNADHKLQQLHDEFTENTISNFHLPFSVAPNFLVDGIRYTIPMVTEESSVVAAACKSAKFWHNRGGFIATVLGTQKLGHIHFFYQGRPKALRQYFAYIKATLLQEVAPITSSMTKRKGGIYAIDLVDKTQSISDYFQLVVAFETADAMGANFINTCVEHLAKSWVTHAASFPEFTETEKKMEINMSILSNYVPQCRVKASVSCPVDSLPSSPFLSAVGYAKKFIRAVQIAEEEPFRAVTHNKGIMNGIDAVVLATGNDFRAIEACAHAYAARSGQYRSLTRAWLSDSNHFNFELEIPLALGTVGGITSLHPLVKLGLQLLGNPNAKRLMKIVAVAGLAQNFAALDALITTGIQQGHMKMHLANILNQLEAAPAEKKIAHDHFLNEKITFDGVNHFLKKLRNV